MANLAAALQANWEGMRTYQARAKHPKALTTRDAVDDGHSSGQPAISMKSIPYHDIFGAPFLTAFMGISNYIPMGRVLGATDGQSTGNPPARGSPLMWGTDQSTPLAAMRSPAPKAQPGGPFRGEPAEPAG